MDHHPNDPLTDLELRLAAWRPNPQELDPDALLFAAGRASARRARLVWPTATACLVMLSALLAGRLALERAQCLALARQLDQRRAPAPPHEAPVPPTAAETAGTEPLPPDSYLIARRALDEGLDAWPICVPGHGPSLPEPPALRARGGDWPVP